MEEKKFVPRNCVVIIDQMLRHVPEEETDLITALQWNREDAMYKAPEETIQWQRTMETLQKHIVNPTKDWHWEVLHIFTTKPIEELKEIHTKTT